MSQAIRTRSFTPIALSWSTIFDRLARCISGMDVGSISVLNAISVYSLKHTPGPVRPARPALCLALACEIGTTTRESMPVLALNTFCLLKPGSTT